MKAKFLIPALLLIIAALGCSLVYVSVQRHRETKRHQQFFLALGVQFYQGLQRGDVEAVKRRLGGDLLANANLYVQKYGRDTDTKFAYRLTEIEAIRADFQSTGKGSLSPTNQMQ